MVGSGANRLFGSSPMESYGSIPNSGGLSLSVLPPQIGLKEESGGGNRMESTSMGGRTLYSSGNIGDHQIKKPPPAPMSATALLQKAALMGSTRSSPGSMFGSSFGLVSSSSPSSSSSQTRSSTPLMKHGNSDCHQQRFRGSSLMDLNSTRDFLGMGGDHGGAAGPHDPNNNLFLHEQLVKFASSIGSGLAHTFEGNAR